MGCLKYNISHQWKMERREGEWEGSMGEILADNKNFPTL